MSEGLPAVRTFSGTDGRPVNSSQEKYAICTYRKARTSATARLGWCNNRSRLCGGDATSRQKNSAPEPNLGADYDPASQIFNCSRARNRVGESVSACSQSFKRADDWSLSGGKVSPCISAASVRKGSGLQRRTPPWATSPRSGLLGAANI
jgi:hypothetical protein